MTSKTLSFGESGLFGFGITCIRVTKLKIKLIKNIPTSIRFINSIHFIPQEYTTVFILDRY